MASAPRREKQRELGTGVAMRAQTERIKDRFNHNVATRWCQRGQGWVDDGYCRETESRIIFCSGGCKSEPFKTSNLSFPEFQVDCYIRYGLFLRIISCCLFEFKVISIKPISLISEHNNAEQLLYSMSTKMEKICGKVSVLRPVIVNMLFCCADSGCGDPLFTWQPVNWPHTTPTREATILPDLHSALSFQFPVCVSASHSLGQIQTHFDHDASSICTSPKGFLSNSPQPYYHR